MRSSVRGPSRPRLPTPAPHVTSFSHLRYAIIAMGALAFALVAQSHRASAQTRSEPVCSAAVIYDSVSAIVAAERLIELGEKCGDQSRLGLALDRLGSELYRRDASAEAWYLAARARSGLARLGAIAHSGPQLVVGMSYAQGALAAARQALRVDSAFAPAASLLADEANRRLAHESGDADAVLLRRATEISPGSQLLLAATRREIEWNHPDVAVALADRAVGAGADTALALLYRARALLMLGQVADGEDAWLAGVASARSDSSIAAYRRDFGWIATDGELMTYDSLSGPPTGDATKRRAWAAAFWDRRGAQDFLSPAIRLATHEERIRFAMQEFGLRADGRDYNRAMPFHSDQHLVDDRGIVYIRHGPPDRVIETGGNGINACPVYSWVYGHGADRGLIVHFRPFFTLLISPIRFCASGDFKLVPGGQWIDANAGQLARYDTLYAEWLSENRPVRRRELERNVVAADVDRILLAATTDAQPRRFADQLPSVVRSYGLSHPSRILIAFSADPTRLGRINRAGPAIPFRLQVAALPRAGRIVTLDTTILYDASRHLRPDQWLVGYVEVPLDAGQYEVRTLTTGADPGTGAFHLQPGVDVPPSGVGEPVVGALVLGTDSSELRWPTPVGEFPVSPLNLYRPGTDVELLLEVQELPANTAVTVEVTLAPLADPKGKAVKVRSTDQAVGSTLSLRRSLNLTGAKPGAYLLTVEIHLPDGRVAARRQRLVVGR